MWPWGHLAVGYFLYSPFARARFGRPPTDRATLWLAVGTQLPDLVDKPLAWRLGVLPAARTLGHSLLTITVVSMLVYAYFERRDRAHVALAFGVGYTSHTRSSTACSRCSTASTSTPRTFSGRCSDYRGCRPTTSGVWRVSSSSNRWSYC
jgi:hypothetical protein